MRKITLYPIHVCSLGNLGQGRIQESFDGADNNLSDSLDFFLYYGTKSVLVSATDFRNHNGILWIWRTRRYPSVVQPPWQSAYRNIHKTIEFFNLFLIVRIRFVTVTLRRRPATKIPGTIWRRRARNPGWSLWRGTTNWDSDLWPVAKNPLSWGKWRRLATDEYCTFFMFFFFSKRTVK